MVNNLFIESTCIDLSVQYQNKLLCGTDIVCNISTAGTVLNCTEYGQNCTLLRERSDVIEDQGVRNATG